MERMEPGPSGESALSESGPFDRSGQTSERTPNDQLPGYPRGGGGPGVLAYPFVFADLLYVADGAGNRINAYTVDGGGNVQTVPGTPITGSGSPTELEAAIVSF